MSISIVLKEITINGMKEKSSVLVGRNHVVSGSYRKVQKGIMVSGEKNISHHCRVYFQDNDYIDTIFYQSKPLKKKNSRKKQWQPKKSKKRKGISKKKPHNRSRS